MPPSSTVSTPLRPAPDAPSRHDAATRRLLDLSVALAAPHPLADVLAAVLSATTDLLACDRASLLLYDATAERLRFVAATSEETEALARIPVPLDGSLAGTVFRERRALVSEDPRSDTRHFRAPAEALDYRPRAIASAPLLLGDECVGVLQALDPHEGGFAEGAADLLVAVAAQAAVAVDAAREHHAAEHARQRLETRDRLHAAVLSAAARALGDGADGARVAEVLGTASVAGACRPHVWQEVVRRAMPEGAPTLLDLAGAPVPVTVDADSLAAAIRLIASGDPAALDVCVDTHDGEAQLELRGPDVGAPLAALRLAVATLLAERSGADVWPADGAVFVSLPLADATA